MECVVPIFVFWNINKYLLSYLLTYLLLTYYLLTYLLTTYLLTTYLLPGAESFLIS